MQRSYLKNNQTAGGVIMKMFIDLFEDSVKRNGDKTSIVADMGNRTVTYAELDLLSSKIARALVEKGVKREDIIPVLLPRSILLLRSGLSKQEGPFWEWTYPTHKKGSLT